MRLPGSHTVVLIALVLLNGCALGSSAKSAPPVAADREGPAADYPVLIGDPYTVDGVTWTPVDKMNYDEVGVASIAEGLESAVSAAHKTLPLPSYVEVTSLETGRTILVRLTERGPMRNDVLVQLSPGAAAQLGLGGTTPVRVRRVNPPEPERAQLRTGGHAAERMATPKPLLAVLQRKLDPQVQVSAPPIRALPGSTPDPIASPTPVDPDSAMMAATTPTTEPAAPRAGAGKIVAKGAMVVQIAAFSTRERAEAVAAGIDGGFVVRPSRYWVVRTGPHASQGDADAALAKARAAGYSDARIQHAE